MVGIEFPLGRTFGQPGDAKTQRSLLSAALAAFETIQTPGEVLHLPNEWVEDENAPKAPAMEPPPIAKHFMTHPLQIRNLLNRKVPN